MGGGIPEHIAFSYAEQQLGLFLAGWLLMPPHTERSPLPLHPHPNTSTRVKEETLVMKCQALKNGIEQFQCQVDLTKL